MASGFNIVVDGEGVATDSFLRGIRNIEECQQTNQYNSSLSQTQTQTQTHTSNLEHISISEIQNLSTNSSSSRRIKGLADNVTMAAISGTTSHLLQDLDQLQYNPNYVLADMVEKMGEEEVEREGKSPPQRVAVKGKTKKASNSSSSSSSNKPENIKMLNLRLKGQLRTIRALEKTVVDLRDQIVASKENFKEEEKAKAKRKKKKLRDLPPPNPPGLGFRGDVSIKSTSSSNNNNSLQTEISTLKKSLLQQTNRLTHSKSLCNNLRLLRVKGNEKVEELEDEVVRLKSLIIKVKGENKRKGEEIKKIKSKEQSERKKMEDALDVWGDDEEELGGKGEDR